MISVLSEWVKGIIFIVLFAGFMELLLPNSSLQRFIRVIMGLLIMLAILNPAIEILQGNWDKGEIAALGGNGRTQADIIRTANSRGGDRDRLAMEIYKKDIGKQIRAVVMAIDGVAGARVSVELQEPAAGAGIAVKRIELYVKPGNSVKSAGVEKVSVNLTKHPELELSDAVRGKIKSILIGLYQMREDQIDIKHWN